jgi:hypothetical protein
MARKISKPRANKFIDFIFNCHTTEDGNKLDIPRGYYLDELYSECWGQDFVIKSSTQSSKSELLLASMYYQGELGLNHFYVLPTEPVRNRFVSQRVNKRRRNNKYYRSKMPNVDNLALKEYGKASFAFVASNSEATMSEFRADAVTIDELDRCDQNKIELARGRTGRSDYRLMRMVSQPTIPHFGIAHEFEQSDQRHWHIKVPCKCKWIEPDFYSHVVSEDGTVFDPQWQPGREPRPICKCGKPFDRRGKGKWVAKNSHQRRGYHISQMFAGTRTLRELLDSYERAMDLPQKLAVFHNIELGLEFANRLTQITEDLLDAARGEHMLETFSDTPTAIGIDPGAVIHWVVGRDYHVIAAGWARNKQELFRVMKDFRVRCGVIDAGAEKHLVDDVVKWGARQGRALFKLEYLGEKQMDAYRVPGGRQLDHKVMHHQMSRTFALDGTHELLARKMLVLPRDIRTVDEFYSHITKQSRVRDEAREVDEWTRIKPDHYFHALTYLAVAENLWRQIR